MSRQILSACLVFVILGGHGLLWNRPGLRVVRNRQRTVQIYHRAAPICVGGQCYR